MISLMYLRTRHKTVRNMHLDIIVPSDPPPKVLIHIMGLSLCKLSSISLKKSVSWSYCKWTFCILEIVACNWEISKDILLWMCSRKCLDNWSQVYALWSYFWGVTQNEEIFQSHLRWICNFKSCISSPRRRAAFSKPVNRSLLSWSVWVWLPQAELAFWCHYCTNVVICIVWCNATPATAAVVAVPQQQ